MHRTGKPEYACNINASGLESFYEKYNRREYVHPDPLEFLYDYADVRDREIAGLIASSLAYGRVKLILKNVSLLLEKIPGPRDFILKSRLPFPDLFKGFKHRLTTGEDVACLLNGIKGVLKKYGSLNECFSAGLKRTDETIIPALSNFVGELSCSGRPSSLLPLPERGSACKRLNLYLRWMIRKDNVDPGGWKGIPASKLIIPLDTHMHRLSLELGLTRRKQADMKTAVEITSSFRQIAPEDPVKYDFALTRPGIQNDKHLMECLRQSVAGRGPKVA